MTIDEFFDKHKELAIKRSGLTTNYQKIPTIALQMSLEGADQFNDIYQDLLKMDLNTLVRTPSDAISNAPENRFNNMYAWDIRWLTSIVEITIRASYECRIQFRQVEKFDDDDDAANDANTNNTNNNGGKKTKKKKHKKGMWGVTAFRKFKDYCREFGINLDDYEDNDRAHAMAVKSTIPKLKVCMADDMWIDKTVSVAHHIDFHNSFPAGLCNTHPEFRPVVEFLYNGRREHPENKEILNKSLGYMQSPSSQVRARWSQLSHDAIQDNNNRIDALAQQLIDAGYIIIAYNTDGIWYAGDKPYHGEGEGPALGQWENDHTFCKLRFKSPGAYEYIEDGKYKPVVRGCTKLEKLVPRSEWNWGDIYKHDAAPIMFNFIEEVGLVDITEGDDDE